MSLTGVPAKPVSPVFQQRGVSSWGLRQLPLAVQQVILQLYEDLRGMIQDSWTAFDTAYTDLVSNAKSFVEAGVVTNTVEISSMSGATVTSSSIFPAGCVPLGVTVEVTGAITGATSFHVGEVDDNFRWGTNIAVALGTKTTMANFEPLSLSIRTEALDLVLTAVGSNFVAGSVRATAHYLAIA